VTRVKHRAFRVISRSEATAPIIESRSATMDMKPPKVVTVTDDAHADHAIATLVLAFSADPIARWILQ
jgi:hypothetical protein